MAASDSLVADSVVDWVASKLEIVAASDLVVSAVLQVISLDLVFADATDDILQCYFTIESEEDDDSENETRQ